MNFKFQCLQSVHRVLLENTMFMFTFMYAAYSCFQTPTAVLSGYDRSYDLQTVKYFLFQTEKVCQPLI